jgi:hypothetical protein
MNEELKIEVEQLFSLTAATFERDFRSLFGISLQTMNFIFVFLRQVAPEYKIKAIHLLWTFHFLKEYPIASVACQFWKCDEKTYRLHVWTILFCLFQQFHSVSKIEINYQFILFTNKRYHF